MNRKENPKNKVITMRLTDDTYDQIMEMKPQGMSWEIFMMWMIDLSENNKTKE